jgi:hypothetical protein
MLKKLSTLFLALTLPHSLLFGDEASGQYFLSFENPPIWDISGDYSETLEGFTLDYTLVSDPQGRFNGQGTFTYEDGDFNSFDGQFTFRGRIRSAHGATRVGMGCKFSGTGFIEDVDATITGRIRKRLEVDVDRLQLAGRAGARFRIHAPGLVRTNDTVIVPDFTSEIPLGMDGTWELTMNVFPDNSNYTGNATIDLSNGSQYSFNLTGKHTVSDLSKFRLKGDESNPRSRFSISTVVTNEEMFVQTLRGRMLGQSVRFVP